MNEVDSIIQKQFKNLPDSVQKLLTSRQLRDTIKHISQTYQLDNEQGKLFETEILLILLKLELPEDFISNLKMNARISRERAEKISKAVNQEILSEVQKELVQPIVQTTQVNEKLDNKKIRQSAKVVTEDELSNSRESIQDTTPKEQLLQGLTNNDMNKESDQNTLKEQNNLELQQEKITLQDILPQTKFPKEENLEKESGTDQKEHEEPKKPNQIPIDPYREPVE